ncbi:hypothetical protein H6F86_07285 [Phormidium sp. FACHB-592]|uniref:Uncharacterized protein n=1 Tax=Stenomitos frigidus AS-A4 TaxID=2933935 RepID=A0ABV0KGQ8_9CYAN|nr:hypothetical protein [Phormidium sp. FACHB-592]MBD2073694.1 hypothetical protein [Phormidium sp. FACHB-592]
MSFEVEGLAIANPFVVFGGQLISAMLSKLNRFLAELSRFQAIQMCQGVQFVGVKAV